MRRAHLGAQVMHTELFLSKLSGDLWVGLESRLFKPNWKALGRMTKARGGALALPLTASQPFEPISFQQHQ